MTLGESIYYYRKRTGLSQEALAEQVGVSRQAVSRWELDDATPELGKLKALAGIFHITVDQLLSGEVPPEEPPREEPPAQEGPRRSDLPGFLGRMVRRHGWLAGIYLSLQGLGIAAVGGLARFGFSRMFRLAMGEMASMGPFGSGGITFTDASGAVVSPPPEVAQAIRDQLGSGSFGGFATGEVSVVSDMGQIFIGIATAVLVIGILVTVAGAILAAVLYRKGRQ